MAQPYRPPGYSIEFEQSPTSASPLVLTRQVVVIGEGSDSLSVKSALITRGPSVDNVDLISSTVAITSIDKVVSSDGTITYTDVTDYSLVSSGPVSYIDWAPTGGITREPAVNANYYISYTYTKQAIIDYQPVRITNNFEATVQFGAAFTTNGTTNVTNSISLGISQVLATGASEIIALQLDPNAGTEQDQWTDAMLKLEEEDSIYYIVPLSNTATVRGIVLAHVAKMSTADESKYRVAWVVPTPDNDPDDYVALCTSITAVKLPDNTSLGERIRTIAPPLQVVSVIAEDRQNQFNMILPSYYGAAALAGLESTGSAADTLNDRAVLGAQGLRYTDGSTIKYTKIEMNRMAAVGVTVIVASDVSGLSLVRDARTCDPTSIISSDPSAIAIKDFVAYTVAKTMIARYKNSKNTSTTFASMQLDLDATLKSFISSSDGILLGYGGAKVLRDPTNPRRAIFTYKINPIQTIRDVLVRYSIDLSLGI